MSVRSKQRGPFIYQILKHIKPQISLLAHCLFSPPSISYFFFPQFFHFFFFLMVCFHFFIPFVSPFFSLLVVWIYHVQYVQYRYTFIQRNETPVWHNVHSNPLDYKYRSVNIWITPLHYIMASIQLPQYIYTCICNLNCTYNLVEKYIKISKRRILCIN